MNSIAELGLWGFESRWVWWKQCEAVRNIGGFECGGDEEEERVRGVERLGKRALYWRRKEKQKPKDFRIL